MRSVPWSILILAPVLALLGACGGSSDDSADDSPFGNSRGSDTTSTAVTGSGSGDKVPTIEDGAYQTGKVHIEITGDQKVTLDMDGTGGFASGGFALFNYGSSTASVIMTFSTESEDAPGGLVVTTSDFATAGEWGKECKVTVDQSGTSVKGQITCDELKAVSVNAAKEYKLKIKGTFTADR